MTIRFRQIITAIVLAGLATAISAQTFDSSQTANLRWRMIGPFRGGRTVGAAGIPDRPNLFFIGVNNGGVWKTDDYGRTWTPVFDSQSTGSVGALAVAPSNPDILYVGSGEGLQRPDLSVGDGMFRSTDGGRNWIHTGLDDAQQIGAVVVDPRDPFRLYVAVLGHPYGPNEQRGVFRSTDGGGHWEKVLYRDENTGAIGLALDPVNPDIIYASLWSSRQGPWENGEWRGKTSGLFKSADAGNTWKQLTGRLPSGADGCSRIGIAVAPSDPSRLYAMVEAPVLGGLYRSDDAGDHWVRVNNEERICGRGDDFAEVKVHPKNRDIVYSANTSFYCSTDGGEKFVAVKGQPGGDDYHSIWINPVHPEIILLASDQGACVSVNNGATWSSWYNQPTAQLYHVATDNQFPYNVYGGQQESGSVGIASRGSDGAVTYRDWHPVAADEWATIAPDPLHPGIVYGGKVTRYDRSTGQVQNVAPEAIRSGQYRTLRTAPLIFSPVDPTTLYFAANVIFKTTNGGHSWEIISSDLTREHPDVPPSIGIFRSPALESQPRRGVIYALACSPLDKNILWAGTDDGLVHLTTDGGKRWSDVTPAGLTSWSKIAGIDAGHFSKGTAFIAVNRFRLDDLRPHIYGTTDFGKSWKEIVGGLPPAGPVNAVREDPVTGGLLFAATERAVYYSPDGGDRWLPLRLNMATSSVRDIVIHGSDIIAATHGRSFWILDNITSLRQVVQNFNRSENRLFRPDTAWRVRWNLYTDTPVPPEESAGDNPPDGAMIDYYCASDARHVALQIMDKDGKLIRSYTSDDDLEQPDTSNLRIASAWVRPSVRLAASAGLHRFVWDMHYPPPSGFPRTYPISAILHNTASRPLGPFVEPGSYRVRLEVDGHASTEPLIVRMDPRVMAGQETLHRQWEYSMMCYDGITRLNEAIGRIDSVRKICLSIIASDRDSVRKDSSRAIAKKLNILKGDELPAEDIDIIYFSLEEGPAVKETINSLRLKLLSLMTLIQGADAEPTESQVTAVTNSKKMERLILDRCSNYMEGLTFLRGR